MNDIAGKVNTIMLDSLFRDEEIATWTEKALPSDAVMVDGITQKFGFHPHRLESHREEVRDLLLQMPINFHEATGGGWSFLNLCMDKTGHQWGEHTDMESLIVLAIGLKLGSYTFPRDMWKVFPGSMPYVVFDVG